MNAPTTKSAARKAMICALDKWFMKIGNKRPGSRANYDNDLYLAYRTWKDAP